MGQAPVATARLITIAAFAYAAIVIGYGVVQVRPLGHDEAVYALGARHLVDGGGAALPLHRSVGMAVVAAPGLALGASDLAMRVPFALYALAYLAVVWTIARRHFGVGAAALAVAVQATVPEFSWRAGEVLSDVPAALCLLIAIAAVLDPRPRPVVAGIAAAAACYVRYASAPVVGALFVIALVIAPESRRAIVGAAALAIALMVPWLVWSHAVTGHALGVLEAGERLARRDYPGHGLVFYAQAAPVRLAGPVAGLIAVVGLVVGAAAWRHRHDATGRAPRLLVAVAVAQIALLGWRVHGEARFVTFAVTALIITGAGWLAAHPARWRVGLGLAIATAVPSAAWTWLRLGDLAIERRGLPVAAAAVRADRGADRCVVFATEAPGLAWYSGCEARTVDGWGLPDDAARVAPAVYLVEARGLRFSLSGRATPSDPRFGWVPIAVPAPRLVSVWRATRGASTLSATRSAP